MKKSKLVTRKSPTELLPWTKGLTFEASVEAVLLEAKRRSRGRLTYMCKPQLVLQNNEKRVPDFSIRIERGHEVRNYHIECQNRKRTSKSILEKISYIRMKHKAKTFFFVHSGRLGKQI